MLLRREMRMRCGSRRLRALVAMSILAGWFWGCGVSRTVKVVVPPRFKEARTASLDELVSRLESQASGVQSLSCSSLKVSFTSGKLETGQLKEYKSAPGYILLRRPDLIRLNIQNPITKTSIAELVSAGDEFGLWVPRDNKYFHGRNSVTEFDIRDNPNFSARPIHIFQAVLPQGFDSGKPEARLSLREEQDSVTKYYVVSVFHESAPGRLTPVRDLWIDRASMSVVRQQTYSVSGKVESRIEYSDWIEVGGIPLPLAIRIERPEDGYSLDLNIREWKLNPDLPDDGFELRPPAGAMRVELREKARS